MFRAPPSSSRRPQPGARQGRSGLAACGVFATALSVAGCNGSAPGPAPTVTQAAEPDAGFAAPPSVTSADWSAAGVALRGRAPAGARVRLNAPDGEAIEALASAQGDWAATAPAGDAPRLFAFSAQLGDAAAPGPDASGRILRGEGALALLPRDAASPALLLRSAAPALPLGLVGRHAAGPRLVSVDFDSGGGLAASGVTTPGAMVRLALDGAPVGQGPADAAGRFAIPGIAAPVAAGLRRIAVTLLPSGGATGAEEVRVIALSAAPPLPAPFRVSPVAGGWRIDWRPPGGGVQSAIVFAVASTRAGASTSLHATPGSVKTAGRT